MMKLWGGHGGGLGEVGREKHEVGVTTFHCIHVWNYQIISEEWKTILHSTGAPERESGQESMEACRSGSDLSWNGNADAEQIGLLKWSETEFTICWVHSTYINEHLEHEPNDAPVDRRDKLIGKRTAWVMLPYNHRKALLKLRSRGWKAVPCWWHTSAPG